MQTAACVSASALTVRRRRESPTKRRAASKAGGDKGFVRGRSPRCYELQTSITLTHHTSKGQPIGRSPRCTQLTYQRHASLSLTTPQGTTYYGVRRAALCLLTSVTLAHHTSMSQPTKAFAAMQLPDRHCSHSPHLKAQPTRAINALLSACRPASLSLTTPSRHGCTMEAGSRFTRVFTTLL